MAAGRVETIRGDHSVKINSLYRHLFVFEDKQVVFYVLADFFNTFICKYRRESVAHHFYIKML
ncbi:hypothetical protein ES703_126064 [subsurface metagenome]